MGKSNVTIFHPEKDGSGCAIKADMNYQTDETPSFIRLTFAKQDGDGFDFGNGIECEMKFHEVSKFISFVNGRTDSLNEGKPLDTGCGTFLAMVPDGADGYQIAAAWQHAGKTDKAQTFLAKSEAFGLCRLFESALFYLAFIRGVNP